MAAKNVPKPNYNILLLGETGVGKSTFINSFANYLKYKTIQEAMKSKLLELIPTTFVMRDKNNETVTVQIGKPGESRTDGESDTQTCKAYLFESQGRIIRLIDTPGIGDTRGLDQDRLNAQKILAFVSHYPILHGIVILLKPNHARLDNSFRFCVMELLCYLHQSACDNIVFVFTNSRGTSFKPGDTLTPLKALLAEIKKRNEAIDIPLSPERMACLDNEGFRFLAALKAGVTFNTEDVEDFSRSWNMSGQGCQKLVDYIVQLKPHKVSDSLSINEARRLIVGFSRPLGDITYQLQINIALVKEQEQKIKSAGEDHTKLQFELLVPDMLEIKTIPFGKPITVCTSTKCIDVFQSKGVDQKKYTQKCHNPCHLVNVTPYLVNNPDLKDCAAMKDTLFSCSCRKCGCSWKEHMHIYYDTELVASQSPNDVIVSNRVQTKEQIIEKSKKILNELSNQQEQLELEQETITRVSARFAHFLQKTAITPFNDAVEDYIQHLIDGEEAKKAKGGTGTQVLEQLQQMQLAYKAEKDILEETFDSSEYTDNAITPKEIYDYCQDLYKLKFTGPIIQKMVVEFEDASRKEHESFTEVIV